MLKMLIYHCACSYHCPEDKLPPNPQTETDVFSSTLCCLWFFPKVWHPYWWIASLQRCASTNIIYWRYCCLLLWALLYFPHILLWLEKLSKSSPFAFATGSLLALLCYRSDHIGLSVDSFLSVFSHVIFRKDLFPWNVWVI